jgi:hypothetical protein
LSALKADPNLVDEVIGRLSRLLAANLNVVRVFVPTMSTITQIMSSDIPNLAGAQAATEIQYVMLGLSWTTAADTIQWSEDRLFRVQRNQYSQVDRASDFIAQTVSYKLANVSQS